MMQPQTPSPQARMGYMAAAPFGEGVSFRPAAAAPRAAPMGPGGSASGGSPVAFQAVDDHRGDDFGSRAVLLSRKLIHHHGHGQRMGWRSAALLLIGACNLLLVVYPAWGAYAMLHDPASVFFVGRELPTWILWACGTAVGVYALVIGPLLRFANKDDKGYEQTAATLTAMVLTGLGLAFIMLSHPLSSTTSQVYKELHSGCEYGAHTQQLYENSQELHFLRASQACSADSVQDCQSFEHLNVPDLTGFLQTLEARYHCAGFCFEAANLANLAQVVGKHSGGNSTAGSAAKTEAAAGGASAKPNSSGTSLQDKHEAQLQLPRPDQLQLPQEHVNKTRESGAGSAFRGGNPMSARAAVGGSVLLPRFAGLAGALQRLAQAPQQSGSSAEALESTAHDPDLGDTVAMLQLRAQTLENVAGGGPPSADTAARLQLRTFGSEVGKVDGYPPTLFSRTGSKVSCDGVVARALKYGPEELGFLLYWEGMALLAIGVLVNTLKVGALCLDGAQNDALPSDAEPVLKAHGTQKAPVASPARQLF